ncbi:interferon gamma receptor 1-like isoform X2 [Hemiscyllium ocellatum]|uniref:interferon gamma receptor 1-like isoform X2 n=1 Tax=Hemiscyllium ocellatum TaxID=170820 RepID=UPI0029672901|nr:interferon gamma receptor 1-like isoform X2 [Hemiscyllium ocellatum]
MCRSRGSVSSLLLSFVLCLCLCLCRSLHGHRSFEILPPVNLSITSYNFHTVLKWDVIDPSRNMRFNVIIKSYSASTWTPFLPCLNISTPYCDLSDAFLPEGGKLGYYAQVNAVTETQNSDFVSTNRFTFKSNATIGPPEVKLKADNTDIIVEVYFMLANSTEERNAKILNKLSYNIYWHSETSKLGNKICNSKKTHHRIEVQTGDICVSAEVYLEDLDLKGNLSQKRCLQIQSSNLSVLPFMTIVIILSIAFSLIATLFICHFVKKKQVLPKVLVHRIMGERGKAYMDVNMESDESNLSEVKGMEKAPIVREVDKCDETQEEITKSSDIFDVDRVNTDVNDSEPVNTDLDDPYAAKIDINGIDQRCPSQDNIEVEDSILEKTSDSYKTNSEPVTQICADNWGYDKPQVLFAL